MTNLLFFATLDASLYFGIALSLWISFRILRYPDLALEQSFVLGSGIYVLVQSRHWPITFLLLAMILTAGVLGTATALLRNAGGINPILVSLLTAYLLYSVSLVLLGRPNVYIGIAKNVTFDWAPAVANAVIVIAFSLASRTTFGLRVVATGSNWELASRKGLRPQFASCVGMAAASLCAISAGSLHAHRTRYADIGSGSGLLLVALFAVLATRAVQRRIHLPGNAVLLFAILTAYLIVLQLVVMLGVPPQWLSAVKAGALLLVLLLMPRNARGDLRLV